LLLLLLLLKEREREHSGELFVALLERKRE